MLSTLTIISLLSSAVFAQDSLIPSSISSSCSSFLQALNSNSTIQECLSPMIEATSSSSASASALSSICSTSVCDDSLIRSTLSNFKSACPTELTNTESGVIGLYDVMYIISPMKTAMCSKSDSGSYCALSTTATSSSAAASVSGVSAATMASQAQQYISTSNGTVNATTVTNTNLPFMFLPTNLTSAQCTTCTRNIMTSYINFESNAPYAPGISSSSLLSQQTTLYNAITSVCGSNFLSGVVQAAGGISTGSSDNGSLRSSVLDIRTITTIVVGMFMAFLL